MTPSSLYLSSRIVELITSLKSCKIISSFQQNEIHRELKTLIQTLFRLSPLEELNQVKSLFSKLEKNSDARALLIKLLQRNSVIFEAPSDDELEPHPVGLLTMVPVIIEEHAYIRNTVDNVDQLSQLESLFLQSGALNAQASFKLFPRLFTLSELLSLSYGAIFRLGEKTFLNMLNGEPIPNNLEHYFSQSNYPSDTSFTQVPGLTVRYLIGMATMLDTADSSLLAHSSYPELIHELSLSPVMEELIPNEVSTLFHYMSNFCTVGAPFELFQTFQESFYFFRSCGLALFLEPFDELDEFESPAPKLLLSYVTNKESSRQGVLIRKVDAITEKPLEVFVWEQLPREHPSECIQGLLIYIDEAGFEATLVDPSDLSLKGLPRVGDWDLLLSPNSNGISPHLIHQEICI